MQKSLHVLPLPEHHLTLFAPGQLVEQRADPKETLAGRLLLKVCVRQSNRVQKNLQLIDSMTPAFG
jgi:hypothetical protein